MAGPDPLNRSARKGVTRPKDPSLAGAPCDEMFAISAQCLLHPPPSAATGAKAEKKNGNLGFGVGRSRVRYRITAALPEEDEKRTGFASRRNESRCDSARSGINNLVASNVRMSTNILWHDCPIGKLERQKLLGQKGCVIWITGLSGSGKSTLACALSRELHCRGFLTYVLDGDNLRHGLNRDLTFKAEDRAENIRRVGEVSKLFADAGVICIASLISPYRKDRDACRALLTDSTFIEVFMDVPLKVCELRDPKGLYKLARLGKIKGFTGIDDPYEPPLDSEIVIQMKDGECPSPKAMAEQVILFLGKNQFLQA